MTLRIAPDKICRLSLPRIPRIPRFPSLFAAQAAFTRLELIFSIIGLLLLLTLVLLWRARSLDLPQRRVCQSNLKQLLRGFADYGYTTGHLPWAARSGTTNAEDWLFWQPERRLVDSALAPYLTNFNARLLRCPSDNAFQQREYPYSYSMNAHLEKLKFTTISNTKDLILLYEENFPNDGACAPGEKADALSRRHLGRSCAGFLDGHVDVVSRSAGSKNQRVQPILKEYPERQR